ncbi:MAG: hypothetical protein V2J25_17030 [Desulfatiglans sp.]|nr:rhomboid family protein [Thermodesulfobacteriota bacterium]MEE4354566.1 hypothetical protein [Desulfatiglans sp.]
MVILDSQRCFHHEHRGAMAQCLECGRYFCLECVTEHNDRVLCSSCLAELSSPSLVRADRLHGLISLSQSAFGMLVLWLLFYYLGQALLSIPTDFHEGTLWQGPWWHRP